MKYRSGPDDKTVVVNPLTSLSFAIYRASLTTYEVDAMFTEPGEIHPCFQPNFVSQLSILLYVRSRDYLVEGNVITTG